MKTQLIIGILLLSQIMMGQSINQDTSYRDPLSKAVRLLYDNDCISYSADFHIKNLFESDTEIYTGKAYIKKDSSHIFYLDLIGYEMESELIFYNDTGWSMNKKTDTMFFLGTGIQSIMHGGPSFFYPQNFFIVDSNISPEHKNYPVARRKGKIATVTVSITEKPKEIDSAIYEINIDTISSFITEIKSIAYFTAGDYLYQHLFLSNFEFPPCDDITLPEEFYSFERVDLKRLAQKKQELPKDTLNMLNGLVLHDLDGKLLELPSEGLIFLDLWYVGCFPCMKSAPHIEALYEKYKDRVHFYSVNEVDADTTKIRIFKEKMKVGFPVLLPDEQGYFAKKLNDNAYPKFLLLDAKTGNLLWRGGGYSEDLQERISKVLDKRL